ncbi:lipase family protein [Myxococcota bacterium]|nr:lipase family protein [Myxococcota bacterium]
MSTVGTLTPGVRDDLSTLITAQSLQAHTEWVSQEPGEIPALLKAAGFTLVSPVITPSGTGGQGYVARRGDQLVISFRGSKGDDEVETILNVLSDVDIRRVEPVAVMPDAQAALAHEGFYQEYLSFQAAVRAAAATAPHIDLFVTGHSLGSSIATHCAVDLALHQERPVTLICSGTPRVGNQVYADQALADLGGAALRITLDRDPVPRLPPHGGDKRGFWHIRSLMCLEADGSPTALKDINGNAFAIHHEHESTAFHARAAYKTALDGLVAKAQARPTILSDAWGSQPFLAAGDAEAKSVEGLI